MGELTKKECEDFIKVVAPQRHTKYLEREELIKKLGIETNKANIKSSVESIIALETEIDNYDKLLRELRGV